MTVETTTRKQSFAGGQSSLVYSFRSLYDYPEYIKVLVVSSGTETALTYGVDYTVAPESDGIGGTVTVSPSYSTACTYTVYRETTDTQTTDYDDYNQFPANTLESDLDRAMLLAQEMAEDIDRALKIAVSSTLSTLSIPDPSEGKALIWSGTSIVNSAYSVDSISTIALNAASTASTQATAASDSAALAANYATSSSTSATLSSNYAASASTSATEASNYATTASTQATLAGNYATSASTSATLAGNYATTASTQATLAGNYATSASTSATLAGNYATSASTSATEASNYVTSASTQVLLATTQSTLAGLYATSASTSATEAANYATTASTQATLAGNYATTCSTIASLLPNAALEFIIDGGGATIETGIKGDLEIPFNCTIGTVTLLANTTGSITIDVWKDTFANFPPTDADSITASAVPAISASTTYQDATLTGWTTSVESGSTLRFNVDSVTDISRVTLSLKVQRY